VKEPKEIGFAVAFEEEQLAALLLFSLPSSHQRVLYSDLLVLACTHRETPGGMTARC